MMHDMLAEENREEENKKLKSKKSRKKGKKKTKKSISNTSNSSSNNNNLDNEDNNMSMKLDSDSIAFDSKANSFDVTEDELDDVDFPYGSGKSNRTSSSSIGEGLTYPSHRHHLHEQVGMSEEERVVQGVKQFSIMESFVPSDDDDDIDDDDDDIFGMTGSASTVSDINDYMGTSSPALVPSEHKFPPPPLPPPTSIASQHSDRHVFKGAITKITKITNDVAKITNDVKEITEGVKEVAASNFANIRHDMKEAVSKSIRVLGAFRSSTTGRGPLYHSHAHPHAHKAMTTTSTDNNNTSKGDPSADHVHGDETAPFEKEDPIWEDDVEGVTEGFECCDLDCSATSSIRPPLARQPARIADDPSDQAMAQYNADADVSLTATKSDPQRNSASALLATIEVTGKHGQNESHSLAAPSLTNTPVAISVNSTQQKLHLTPSSSTSSESNSECVTIGKITYSPSEVLGMGRFGHVYAGTTELGRVAVKVYCRGQTDRLNNSPEPCSGNELDMPVAMAATEHYILKLTTQLQYQKDDHIVRLLGFEQLNDLLYIAMERCACSLADIFNHKHLLVIRDALAQFDRVRSLGGEMLDGLSFLHSHNILHNDIKPSSIMFDMEGGIRIIGFGVARHLVVDKEDRVAPQAEGANASPGSVLTKEPLEKQQIDFSVDVLAAGRIIMWLLCDGQYSFDKAAKRVPGQHKAHLLRPYPEAYDVVGWMTSQNPKFRPTAAQARCHPFFLTQLRKNNYITIVSNGWRLFESSFSDVCWNCPTVQECLCRSCTRDSSTNTEGGATPSSAPSVDSLRWVCSCTVSSRALSPWTDSVDPQLLQKMSKYE